MVRMSRSREAPGWVYVHDCDRCESSSECLSRFRPVARALGSLSVPGLRERCCWWFSVGVDMPVCQDGVLIGNIEDSDELFQKVGRLGRRRNLVSDARAIVYVSRAARTAAEKALADVDATTSSTVDISMAEMTVGHCKTKTQNRLYNQNLTSENACSCSTCLRDPPPLPRESCNCSGCLPEDLAPILKPITPPKGNSLVPKKKRLTKVMRAHGFNRLVNFRIDIWCIEDNSKSWMLPPDVYLPNHLINDILDRYAIITLTETLSELLKSCTYIDNHHAKLLQFLTELKPEFDVIAAAKKAEAAAKAMNLSTPHQCGIPERGLYMPNVQSLRLTVIQDCHYRPNVLLMSSS